MIIGIIKNPVEYSKFLEKHFGDPDEFTNEQTVWHNIDGSQTCSMQR